MTQISYEDHFEKNKEQVIKKKSPKNLRIYPPTHTDKAQKTTMEGGRWRGIGDTMLPGNYGAFIFVDDRACVSPTIVRTMCDVWRTIKSDIFVRTDDDVVYYES